MILGGDHRFFHDLGNVGTLDDHPLFDGEFLDGDILVIVDRRQDGRVEIIQIFDLRESLLIHQQDAQERAQQNGHENTE